MQLVRHLPPAKRGRIFVTEQFTGDIRLVDLVNRTLQLTPVLHRDVAFAGHEQGLLGLAFDPEFATNGYFYLNYTPADNNTHIVRFRMVGDPLTSTVADPDSAHTLLTIVQPQVNHNGGWMSFGPDGYLYIGMGDGGNGLDVGPGHTPETGNARISPTICWAKSSESTSRATTFQRTRSATTQFRRAIHSLAKRGTTRFGPTACAIRGGPVSTASPATCGLVMWAKVHGKKLIYCQRVIQVAPISAGDFAREPLRRRIKLSAGHGRPVQLIRCTITRTCFPIRSYPAARSRAASSTADPLPRFRAFIFSTTRISRQKSGRSIRML